MNIKGVARGLGAAGGGLSTLASMRLEAIQARTRADLVEVARCLDLKGVSRKPKLELARCILEALRKLASVEKASARREAAGPDEKKGTAEAVAQSKPARVGKAVTSPQAQTPLARPQAPVANRPVVPASRPIAPKPVATPAKPVATSPKPVATSPKPIATSPKPVATSPKPVATSPKPVATPPKSVANPPKPAAKPPKPDALASRPAAAKQAGGGAQRAGGKAKSRPAEPGRAGAELAPLEAQAAAAARLDIGPAGKAEKPVAHIPWSYGMDRVVAAAVDPDRLYAYWEVTDQAIEKARAGLGPAGAGAWLNLRVHDTTDLIFDGTNAHSTHDHAVDRSDRQWFFDVGRPTSTVHVEIGMKSAEGYFVRIARSGRVDFPRKEPASWDEPEWLTVIPGSGELRGAGTGAPASPSSGASRAAGEPPPPFAPIALWRLHEAGERAGWKVTELLEGGWERVEWWESEGEGWYELEGRTEWMAPTIRTTWEAGPFPYPVEVEPPSREEWRGPTVSFKVGGVTHVIHGPWQVVIRELGGHREHAVLGRWQIYRSWVAEEGREVRPGSTPGGARMPGASEHLGASERRWISGSELRLAGASELWRLGASEVRLGGASEARFVGASERRIGGASEVRFSGASEWRLGGASELARAGGSETRLGGSEGRLGGASEQRGGPGGLYPKVEE